MLAIMSLKNIKLLNTEKIFFLDKDSKIHDDIDEVFRRKLDLSKDIKDLEHELR